MREIKFRAWSDEEKKMWYDKTSVIFTYIERRYPFDVMQYTGLKDREGAEIYEGDIIHFSYGIPPRGVNAEVVYQAAAFYALTTSETPKRCVLIDLIRHVGGFRIVGNKFENPELLTTDR